MSQDFKFELSAEMMEKLEAYGALLEKDSSTMLNEALNQYFADEEKRLLEQRMNEKDPDTDIGFDEFWADVDI